MKTTIAALFGVALSLAVSPLPANEMTRLSPDDWPTFRGPAGRSVAQPQDLPTEWSVEDGTNVAWQADLPGRGVSGPIVVDGKVIVTASSGPDRDRLHVIAFDSQSGDRLWHRRFWATGKSMVHSSSANAAPTPACDGERIFAYFSSNDIISLDLDGNLLWVRGLEMDYPGSNNALGMSSSPVVVGDVVVLQSEAQGNSFVAALDRETGETRWDVERPRASNWVSPIGVDAQHTVDQQPIVILQSGEGIKLHNANNGEVLLSIDAPCETIPSLTFDKYLYAPSNGIRVFDVMSAGLEEKDQPVWEESKLRSSSSSPVVLEDQIYVINRDVLSCGSLTDRDVSWKLRLGGQFWATPVLVGDYLYCINADGTCYVVDRGAPGGKGTIVAENEFGENVYGSPAVADDGLFVRSHAHLWKIAK